MSSPALLTYVFTTLPDPLQISAPASLMMAVDNQTGMVITCTQIVVTFPVGTNAQDLIAVDAIDTTPGGNWTYVKDGGSVVLTPPGNSAEIAQSGLSFMFAMTVNDQVGGASIIVEETASAPGNPAGPRWFSWLAAKFPANFSLGAGLLPVPKNNLNIGYDSPAQMTWDVTGDGVTCTLSYQPTDGNDWQTGTVDNSPKGGVFSSLPLTRSGSVVFTLTAKVTGAGQDQPITREAQMTVTIDAMSSLSVVAQPLTIPPGGLAQIQWNAPNAIQCVTKEGAVLPATGMAYVMPSATRDYVITAHGAGGQVLQSTATVTVDPTLVATPPGQSVVGATGPQGPSGGTVALSLAPVAGNNNEAGGTITINGTSYPITIDGDSTVVTVDGITRTATQADAAALAALMSPVAPNGSDGVMKLTLPPLDLSGDSRPFIPLSVTGGTGGAGGAGATYSYSNPGGTNLSVPGPGCPGGNGGNAYAEITIDQTLTPAQYIFTLAPGAGGPGGSGSSDGPAGAPGQTCALAFDGLVVPLDGSLVAPVTFGPLTLNVTAAPAIVPMNGLALIRWNAPNADHCVFPDGTVVPPKGRRYVVMTESCDFQITAYDDFGRSIQAGTSITVDPTIQPTETGSTQTGTIGKTGDDGTCPTWTFDMSNYTPPSGWTPGLQGGTGTNATLALTIPPLDTNGTSTRVIPITVTGGSGGTGGVGGWLIVLNAPQPYPSPFDAQFPIVASPGGPGGTGGDATLTLTVDPTQPPARIILNVAGGAGGAGGESGWRVNTDGSSATSYGAVGAVGNATVTINGQSVELAG